MAITTAELVLYLSTNRPLDDATTSGGSIAGGATPTHRPLDTELSANAVAAVVSDGADTRTIRVTGRLATGVIDTEDLVLNGTNEVVGSKTWERWLKIDVQVGGASGTRTVSVKQGSGGTTRHQILPNELGAQRLFYNSASATSAVTRYEKVHFKNGNGSLTLTSASVKIPSGGDPSSRMRIGCDSAGPDSSASVTNRVSAPAGVTFVDDNVSQSVPGGGNVAAGSNIGIWAEQALLAPGSVPDGAFKSSLSVQMDGQSI